MATAAILGVTAVTAAILGRSMIRQGIFVGKNADKWVKGGFKAKMDRKEAIEILGLKYVLRPAEKRNTSNITQGWSHDAETPKRCTPEDYVGEPSGQRRLTVSGQQNQRSQRPSRQVAVICRETCTIGMFLAMHSAVTVLTSIDELLSYLYHIRMIRLNIHCIIIPPLIQQSSPSMLTSMARIRPVVLCLSIGQIASWHRLMGLTSANSSPPPSITPSHEPEPPFRAP